MYEKIDIDHRGHFNLRAPRGRDFKILQLTDLHLGFGPFSRKADRKVLSAMSELIKKSEPDFIVLTGDVIYPFLPKSGTLNNGGQMEKLIRFLDSFQIPYSLVLGNHDVEMGSRFSREELAAIITSGSFSIFSKGPNDIMGIGNYIINLRGRGGELITSLIHMDTNMYGGGWFFSGFDCLHKNQIDWCMTSLEELKKENDNLQAQVFLHMPLREYKFAYEKMKSGSTDVTYHFGSISEKNDYFGISKNECDFFDRALEGGIIKGIYCGHDHLNTLSLTHRGIRMTYGMSLDYHAYKGIKKWYIQRGGTIITIDKKGKAKPNPLPLGPVVSSFVRGQ